MIAIEVSSGLGRVAPSRAELCNGSKIKLEQFSFLTAVLELLVFFLVLLFNQSQRLELA